MEDLNNAVNEAFDCAVLEYEEVSLMPDVLRPATTEELVEMLKQAGTELTVKYLTGEITFESFCKELEKSKCAVPSKPILLQRQAQSSYSTGDIPAFDKLLEEASQEEIELEDDEDDDEDADELDARQLNDDDEWLPDVRSKKQLTGKKEISLESAQAKCPDGEIKKQRKKKRKQFDLPKELSGINGQAMLLRAQGKTDEAVSLLYEIINRMPKAAIPYHALGSIHEEKGDLDQALKFYMVAANLKGLYATEWMDLAEMCITQKEEKMALICFARAMRNASTNTAKLQILARKCEFLEQSPIKVLQCKEQMIHYMDKARPGAILTFARNIANDFVENDDETGAISVYQYMHKEFPNEIDSEDVHHLAELLMSQKNYEKSLEIIIRHCGVEVVLSNHTPSADELLTSIEKFASKEITLDRLVLLIKSGLGKWVETRIQKINEDKLKVNRAFVAYEKLTFPHLMPIDLRSKLLQCILFTKALSSLEVIKELIISLTEHDVEQYGDIHYDIAETMVECGYQEEAKPILLALTNSDNFNKAAVWLTYGQCLNALGDIKEAANAYTHVVDLAPGHYSARVTLSSLLQQMGKNDVALEVLSKGPSEEGEATADQLLLIHKCQLLHSQGKIDEFISTARKLLSYHFPGQLKPDFIKVLLGMRTTKSRRSMIPHITGTFSAKKKMTKDKVSEGETIENKDGKEMMEGEVKKFRASLWDVYVKVCKAMHDRGMNDELLETVTLGLICREFSSDQSMVKEAEFLCLKIGPMSINLYYLARSLIIEEKENVQAWNLYCYIMTHLKEVTDLRFTVRALMKNPNSLALGMLNGNSRMISGTYKQALTEYLSVLRKTPDNDMALLCAALCLAHIASQSYTSRKNPLISQVICLMTAYKEMRGECQETYYNMGRVMQQLNILYAAVFYFKKALTFPPVVFDEHEMFDLQHEIAYSLALIYSRTNNPSLASYYIDNFCVI